MQAGGWCDVCEIAVNFSNKSQAVAHYRSKKHRLQRARKPNEVSEEEKKILELTDDEALAITRPTSSEKEYVPQTLVAHCNGKTFRVFCDIPNGNVK